MRRLRLFAFFLFCLLVCGVARAQSVAPIQGLGQIQFFSNTGAPLTNGVLYSYQAGTTTQQATFTDSTGTVQNPNPITFTTGARAAVWLTVGAFYKFVLCTQNDGASCAPGDTIYSVDQVPGGSTGSSGGSSPFTGIFISQTATPATTGILRLASGDSICWRNAAGTTNLCISKDSSDLLNWAGGSFNFPEVSSIVGQCGVAGRDCFWADNTAHRWMMTNNGGGGVQVVASGVDINTSDQVNQLHFGATGEPLCNTAPTAGQALQFIGGCIGGLNAATESTLTWGSQAGGWNIPNGLSICSTALISSSCVITVLASPHTLLRLTYIQNGATVGCSPLAAVGVRDLTAGANIYSQNIPNSATNGFTDSGALAVAMPAGHIYALGFTVSPAGCGTIGNLSAVTMVYQ